MLCYLICRSTTRPATPNRADSNLNTLKPREGNRWEIIRQTFLLYLSEQDMHRSMHKTFHAFLRPALTINAPSDEFKKKSFSPSETYVSINHFSISVHRLRRLLDNKPTPEHCRSTLSTNRSPIDGTRWKVLAPISIWMKRRANATWKSSLNVWRLFRVSYIFKRTNWIYT